MTCGRAAEPHPNTNAGVTAGLYYGAVAGDLSASPRGTAGLKTTDEKAAAAEKGGAVTYYMYPGDIYDSCGHTYTCLNYDDDNWNKDMDCQRKTFKYTCNEYTNICFDPGTPTEACFWSESKIWVTFYCHECVCEGGKCGPDDVA